MLFLGLDIKANFWPWHWPWDCPALALSMWPWLECFGLGINHKAIRHDI